MRYLPASEEDIRQMLGAIGAASVEDLLASIPKRGRLKTPLDLPEAVAEPVLRERYVTRSVRNSSPTCRPCFLGAGAYDHYSPAPIDQLLLRAEFYTAYTPYQPEMAQGTLQAIFEFQTMMADLTGMDVSNASLYDGASATAEAALMAHRIHKGKTVLVARSIHPAYREVLRTYTKHLGFNIEEVPFGQDGRVDLGALKAALSPDVCLVLVGQPNFFGVVEDLKAVAALSRGCQEAPAGRRGLRGPLPRPARAARAPAARTSCAARRAPSASPRASADPTWASSPPSRPTCASSPAASAARPWTRTGRRGFVLTLTTREQHIRREKATSNICTNEGLCMLAATIYLASMGRKGLSDLAVQNLSKAEYLKGALNAKGIEPLFGGPTFNEFAVKLPVEPRRGPTRPRSSRTSWAGTTSPRTTPSWRAATSSPPRSG